MMKNHRLSRKNVDSFLYFTFLRRSQTQTCTTLNNRKKKINLSALLFIIFICASKNSCVAFLPIATYGFVSIRNVKEQPSSQEYRNMMTKHYNSRNKKKEYENVNITTSRKGVYIRFSRAFQMHIVFKCKIMDDSCLHYDCNSMEDIGSFLFLDEAIRSFPNAELVKIRDSMIIGNNKDSFEMTLGGMGTTPSIQMMEYCENPSYELIHEAFEYLTSLSIRGQRQPLPPPKSKEMHQLREKRIRYFKNNIAPYRIASHSPESLHRKYDRVMDILTRGRYRRVNIAKQYESSNSNSSSENLLLQITKIGLALEEAEARAIIAEFPNLCLYDIHELEDRIKFMIAPMGKFENYICHQNGTKKKTKSSAVDYYKALGDGYGAGLSIKQATNAIKAIPQFLSMYYEDSRKPSIVYFYRDLQVTPDSVNAARSELSQYMLGCNASDMCAFAYLNSLGVTWDQIRLLLNAFATFTYCDLEPGWELVGRGPIRSELKEEMLHFLRQRLQISNPDIHSMLKTHSRLSTYGVEGNIKPTLNALQHRLGLSSAELRQLVLRMPSVIGMHVDSSKATSSLDKRIEFFINEVQLNPDQLKNAILKQPSLLQYSLHSLGLKIKFLIEEVGIPNSSIARVINTAPAILGLSLEQNLKPTVATLRAKCNLSSQELSEMIVTCPSILSLSIKRKIDPTITFLSGNLYLSSSEELGFLIKSAPRILLQSVESSLMKKICMMRDAVNNEISETSSKSFHGQNYIEVEASSIFKKNPALLATTNSILERRISECRKDPNKCLAEVFVKRKVGRKRLFSGPNDVTLINHVDQKQRIDDDKVQPKSRNNCPTISFSAFVSGSVYPADNINEARGKRKAGGLAIYIQKALFPVGDIKLSFQSAIDSSFGMLMPEGEGGSNAKKRLVLVGFPFLRPSRNRCDLYACHCALKVMLQLLKQASLRRDLRNVTVDIEIYTDSSYAWNLLKNSTQLLNWGSHPTIEEFVYDGDYPIGFANRDLLYPLSKTIHGMVRNTIVTRDGTKLCLGNIHISFRHSGEVVYDIVPGDYTRRLNSYAKKAAIWQFKKTQIA